MRVERNELLVHTKRILTLIEDGTTDLAESQLRVPVEHYASPQRWQREVDTVFRRHPMPVAFSCELREPGQYRTVDITGLPLVACRGTDGVARVFLNVCRHRGAQLVPAGCGSVNRFTCPYHSWMYDTDGALLRVPSEHLVGEIDRATHGLTELPSEERHGIVFAVLNPAATIDLSGWLGDFEPELERIELADRHVAWVNEIPGANWKLCADGYTETYHFPFLHPATINVGNLGNVMAHDSWQHFQRIFIPRRSIARLRDGIDDTADLANEFAAVHYLFPSTMLSSSWGRWTFISQVWPGRQVGESTTVQLLVSQTPLDDAMRAEAARLRESYYSIIKGDDYHVGASIQLGLCSGANSHITMGRNEIGTQHFHRWLDRFVGEA